MNSVLCTEHWRWQKPDRREFLKVTGGAALTAVVSGVPIPSAAQRRGADFSNLRASTGVAGPRAFCAAQNGYGDNSHAQL
ncbi:twin-arginine translocation signal domain-containing protein [Variovorax sp. J31P179]|uniref:twin-arginine translocation signal domain-containing protein n=1 Tax=Variovorax sp. J31P179 TaxID=3053508 RepID=UPI00336547C7